MIVTSAYGAPFIVTVPEVCDTFNKLTWPYVCLHPLFGDTVREYSRQHVGMLNFCAQSIQNVQSRYSFADTFLRLFRRLLPLQVVSRD